MTHKRLVRNCGDCPFLFLNMDWPETICKLNGEDWGMGTYKGGPAPDWCPLRKGEALVKLR